MKQNSGNIVQNQYETNFDACLQKLVINISKLCYIVIFKNVQQNLSYEKRTLKYDKRALIYDVKGQNCIFQSVAFCESMCKSRKLSICLLFDLCKNNQRTKLCKSLSNIANETYVGKLSLNKSLVKSNMIYVNPAENAWSHC